MAKYSDEELLNHFKSQGLEQAEIEKIFEKLQAYDSSVFRQSIFDAIETGGFDLRAVIDEAMGEDSAGKEE